MKAVDLLLNHKHLSTLSLSMCLLIFILSNKTKITGCYFFVISLARVQCQQYFCSSG